MIPFERFDRSRLRFRPVAERRSRFEIDDIAIDPDAPPPDAGPHARILETVADELRAARTRGAPIVVCHGAHPIKNGLAPLLIRFITEGWFSHLATNGAGSIHDWEFAFLGRSTENVRENVAVGQFGLWEETGAYIGLALHVGALDGLGYGASVGRLIAEERLSIPSREALESIVKSALSDATQAQRGAAALDLIAALETGRVKSGELAIPHPWKHISVQCACAVHGVPFTVHPGIGQDIIYSHPLVAGAPMGRAALTDFEVYAKSIEGLEGGVYLSVGSSVMSPMIFEKSLSMARNVLGRDGRELVDFSIVVNDLAESHWDWSRGEPPVDDPAYYVRFMKSFARMGGRVRYLGLDNRILLHNLYALLRD